jgi:hypothetical protein
VPSRISAEPGLPNFRADCASNAVSRTPSRDTRIAPTRTSARSGAGSRSRLALAPAESS